MIIIEAARTGRRNAIKGMSQQDPSFEHARERAIVVLLAMQRAFELCVVIIRWMYGLFPRTSRLACMRFDASPASKVKYILLVPSKCIPSHVHLNLCS